MAADRPAARVRQWPELTPDEMEAKADRLVEYGNSLPDGVTTEAFAEAANLRREARQVRCGNNGPSCRRDDCPWPEGRCVERDAAPIRGWVARLGSYLRIFGVGSQPDSRYIDALVTMAKEREAEHGR